LLNCLHSNKTLKRLELAGNNVPSDILKAVGKYYLLYGKESVTPFRPEHLRDIGHLLLQNTTIAFLPCSVMHCCLYGTVTSDLIFVIMKQPAVLWFKIN